MIGCFFIYIYVLFLNIEIYFEQNQFVAVASITAAIVNVTLNYFCINEFGYIAAAYTTMVSYMLMAVMHYVFMRKIAKRKQGIASIFDIQFILICSIALLIFGAALLKLYEMLILRWIIIAIFCAVLLRERKNIMIMVSVLKKRD